MNMKRWIIFLPFICLGIFTGCLKGIQANDIHEPSISFETMLTKALNDLGMMTEIYGSSVLKIQSSPMVDRTGPEWKKGGENSQILWRK